jgi:hypothetical protein
LLLLAGCGSAQQCFAGQHGPARAHLLQPCHQR